MKIISFIILSISLSLNCLGQNFQLKLVGTNESENKIVDSLSYTSNHFDLKSITDEIAVLSEKLSRQGYLENQFQEKTKVNDSCYSVKFNLGKKLKWIHIYIGKTNLLQQFTNNSKNKTNQNKDFLILPFTDVERFLLKTTQKLEQNGYAFAKLQLINFKIIDDALYSELQTEIDAPRKIKSIVVQFPHTDKKNSFPSGHLAQINRKYRNLTFNKKNVSEIYEDFQKFRFVGQIKYPEILFTKDTTKVFVYLKEKQSNTFDGFIGFTNNNTNKIRFNGYLDVSLENTLKVGEQFSLFWKSDGNNQKTFRAGIEIPYIFKSPFSLKAKLNIFKQDSIFQNTKTEINLGYYIDYNTRVFVGYQATESSDIQNTNSKFISDYKNSFITSNLDYTKFDIQNSNFPIKTKLAINIGFGNRSTNTSNLASGKIQQLYLDLQAMHNLYINPKNCLNINYHNYFLKSDAYIINELYRFGGINTIRGFAENVFQADWMTSIQTEYRYIISPSLYLHSILDYCYFEDKSLNIKEQLSGIGIGLGLNTKTGLFKFAFANGITKKDTVKLNNSIIHMSYSIRF